MPSTKAGVGGVDVSAIAKEEAAQHKQKKANPIKRINA
jgi:hypothetical protein